MRYETLRRAMAPGLFAALLVTPTVLTPTPPAGARGQNKPPANQQTDKSKIQVVGTWSKNGANGRFRAAFEGPRIVAVRELIKDAKTGNTENTFTYDDKERVRRFEGSRPTRPNDDASARVKETITWNENGKVTSASRAVAGKSQPVNHEAAGAIRAHGDWLHGEAEKLYRKKVGQK